MAILNDFEYEQPKNLKETFILLSKFQDKAKILAGGTDLIVNLKEELAKPKIVIDIKGITELNKIDISADNIFIGAGITFTEIMESTFIKEKLPILWEASKKVASIGIRNRATIVGNICSAVPSLDSAPALLVYNAEVIVQNEKNNRIISIHDWFVRPKKTTLNPDELVLGIKIPIVKHAGVYEKLGRYKGEDLAQAGIGIFVDEKMNYRFAYCAVGPIPKRMKKLEEFLKGKVISNELIEEATELIPDEISPISDIRSSKEYRTHMMKVMFKRGLQKSVADIKGDRL
ncbi:MAG: xanthine dehydrogenase family protein subunit M [Candidatus Marinimicrobia bacterium]|jgi:CO/xanthine dehydrogenase FAD-binding subunit|nr:xanthine dehydrogenase family protein subunit M [Candidatus Neomarinimicrobiota bacterium]